MLSEKEVAMMIESVGSVKTIKYLSGIIIGQDIAYKATVGTYLKTLVQMGGIDKASFNDHMLLQEPIYKSCLSKGFDIVGMPIQDENAATTTVMHNSWLDMVAFWAKTTFWDNLDEKETEIDENKEKS